MFNFGIRFFTCQYLRVLCMEVVEVGQGEACDDSFV